jgi:hypothetical protein
MDTFPEAELHYTRPGVVGRDCWGVRMEVISGWLALPSKQELLCQTGGELKHGD